MEVKFSIFLDKFTKCANYSHSVGKFHNILKVTEEHIFSWGPSSLYDVIFYDLKNLVPFEHRGFSDLNDVVFYGDNELWRPPASNMG